MVGDLETLDHQPVQAPDGQCVEDGKCAIAAFLTGDQDFPARHTFRIRQGFLNDEQPSQGDREHRAQ